MPGASDRPIRCALLSAWVWAQPSSIILSTPGVEFLTLSGAALGIDDPPNPFGLQVADTADVVVVSSQWYEWLHDRHGDAAESVLRRVESCGVPVGLDEPDEFALALPPEAFDRFALVLKAAGVYRDRDLYNWEVGCRFPGANWSEKLRPAEAQYSAAALEKLRVSVPCFMAYLPALRSAARGREVRAGETRRMSPLERRARDSAEAAITYGLRSYPIALRDRDVHCLLQLNHVQRIDVVHGLAEFSGVKGITRVPERVAGTAHGWELPADALERIRADAAPLMHPSLGRARYLVELCRHRVGVAPTGYGEITFRHGEILRAGAALVSQSLEHVETLFPFEDGKNVVFCRPDLSDLAAKVRELLADEGARRRIAAAGRRDYHAWSRNWREVLRAGVAETLLEALGRDRERVQTPGSSGYSVPARTWP